MLMCGLSSVSLSILFRHQQGKPYAKALKRAYIQYCAYIYVYDNRKKAQKEEMNILCAIHILTFTPIISSLVQGWWLC